MRRPWLLLTVLLAGCGATPAVEVAGDGARDADAAPDVAWEHLQQVEGTLPDLAAAAVVEDEASLAEVWDTHGFGGPPPAVDLTDHLVLLLGQADDACPDELVRLEVTDGDLAVGWSPPPGACEQPLIMRLHAVVVHRGVLGDGFSYGLAPPYDADLAPVTIDLAPYEGGSPPAPEPPRAMDDEELDAVFADHPVRRCGPEHEVLDLDGPPDAARDPRPVASIEAANDALAAAGVDVERAVIPFVDRLTGDRLAYLVAEEDAERIDAVLTDAFGGEAPDTRVSPWAPAEVRDAADALQDLMGGDPGPGSIIHLTAGPGPARLGMVDPTRVALDAVAGRVDPRLVCIEPELTGVHW